MAIHFIGEGKSADDAADSVRANLPRNPTHADYVANIRYQSDETGLSCDVICRAMGMDWAYLLQQYKDEE